MFRVSSCGYSQNLKHLRLHMVDPHPDLQTKKLQMYNI